MQPRRLFFSRGVVQNVTSASDSRRRWPVVQEGETMTGKDARLRLQTIRMRREGLRTKVLDELANLRVFKKDARLRNQTLRARREALRAKLVGELANLRGFEAADCVGDDADAAFEAEHDEMSSQLAELYIQEVSQIEEALERLEQGTYGLCEGGS